MMSSIAGQVVIPSEWIAGWAQLGLVIAVCMWLLGFRRGAGAMVIAALAPLLFPAYRPLLDELRLNLFVFVPWYVGLPVAIFLTFIVLRGIIGSLMGAEIATRTSTDLLILPIAGLFGAFVASVRFVFDQLSALLRR